MTYSSAHTTAMIWYVIISTRCDAGWTVVMASESSSLSALHPSVEWDTVSVDWITYLYFPLIPRAPYSGIATMFLSGSW